MESQKSWYDLKLSNKNALKEDWKFPEEPLVQGQWTFQSKDIFNSAWIKYCQTKGIHLVGDVMLFYKAPLLNSYRAHTDINENNHTTWAMNWCLDDDSGTMYWYEPPTDDIDKIYPSKDSRYIEWDTRKLNLLDQKDIKQDMRNLRQDKGRPHEERRDAHRLQKDTRELRHDRRENIERREIEGRETTKERTIILIRRTIHVNYYHTYATREISNNS